LENPEALKQQLADKAKKAYSLEKQNITLIEENTDLKKNSPKHTTLSESPPK